MSDATPDDAELAAFNYKPELKRRLGRFGSFAFAYTFISVSLGIFSNYGYLLTQAGPFGIWTWPAVAMGQMLVAMIFAEMSGRIPLSGYAYQWVKQLAGRGWGWLTGWICICNITISIVAINVICATMLTNLFGLQPSPRLQTEIVFTLLTVQFIINSFQVRLAARFSNLATFTEIAGIMGLIILLLVAMTTHNAWHPEMLFTHSAASGSYWPHFMLATLLAAWALVGFETAADMSEETLQSRRIVPFAVMASLILSAIMGFVALVVVTLAIPDLAATTQSDMPIVFVFEHYWGHTLAMGLIVFVAISITAASLVGMTSVSRLIYAMARDGVFPAAGFFRHVSPAGVPWRAVGLVFAAGVTLDLFADHLTSLFSASSILFATVYLITVAAYALKAKTLPPTESFSLRRGRYVIIALAIIWLLFEMAVLILPEDFHSGAWMAGGVCLRGAVLYNLLYRNKWKRL